jgi:RHS repeat-associated protein
LAANVDLWADLHKNNEIHAGFRYDANSNPSTKSAPAPNQTGTATVTTTYSYDALNRLSLKSYSDGTTPSANFLYDTAVGWSNPSFAQTNLIGRLSETYVGAPAEQVFGYDQMGRVSLNNQCTPAVCGTSNFPLSYTYDLAGNLTSSTNGFGVTLSYNYSAAARLQSLTSSLVDSNHPASLLSSVTYNALAQTTAAKFGNGLAEAFSYNPRAQLLSISAGDLTSNGSPGTGSAPISGTEQSIQGLPALSGTGNVTFSGTVQSKQVQNAAPTPGTGTVTIGGAEQSITGRGTPGQGSITISGSEREVFPCPGCPGFWDGGTLGVSVNGTLVANINYGTSSSTPPSPMPTAASLASQLAAAINSESSLVSAILSGSTIILTSRTGGANTNYSLSTQVNSSVVRAGHPPASFTMTPSGSTLTGGTTGATTYDSGTAWVTVNATQYSVSYGQSSTSATVASALASAMTAGSLVNATASGSGITIVAKATGAATNYSLSSGSSTSQSGSFSSPSFTVSVSGAALTGGANAVYTTRYDSGTSTITVNGHGDTTGWSGSSTTASTIASALASAINADSSASATASVSGAVVSLTAKTTGASTDYSLSSSYTYDSTDFSSSSFTSSNSGSALTGGRDAVATVYDSGTVWVTVNGFQVSVSYGQNSTSSTVASAIVSAFNTTNGSPVTASVAGSLISLTATTVGSSTNYSLSAGSSTSNPGQFSAPSFSVSTSGASLTGASGPIYAVNIGYTPNGNVTSANDSANGNWNYQYDQFNRLVCSNLVSNGSCSSPSNGTPTYTYIYDRFGNRWQQNGPNSMILSFTGNNTTNNNRIDGYCYDSAGNLLDPGPCPTPPAVHLYAYDAENRLTSVGGGATASYVYDTNGRRVRKTAAGVSVDYLYDLGGKQITELSSTGSWNRGEVYAGGRHLATYDNGTTYFIDTDWLGTERARTTVSGSLYETCSSLPFGDGLSCSGGDPSPMHFTGEERDGESGLDNFGARYFGSNMGRFMLPDELFADQDAGDPQSWNLYAFVRNNPLRFTDSDGRACVSLHGEDYHDDDSGGQTCAEADAAENSTTASAIVTPSHDDQIKMLAEDIGNIGTAELKQDVLIMAAGAAGEAANAGIGILSVRGQVVRGGIAPVLKGVAGETRAIAQIEAEGGTVIGTNVTIKTNIGKGEIRADILYKDAEGNLMIGEAKNGPTAEFNNNQLAHGYAEGGPVSGTIAGTKGGPLYPAGTPISNVPIRTFAYGGARP